MLTTERSGLRVMYTNLQESHDAVCKQRDILQIEVDDLKERLQIALNAVRRRDAIIWELKEE